MNLLPGAVHANRSHSFFSTAMRKLYEFDALHLALRVSIS